MKTTRAENLSRPVNWKVIALLWLGPPAMFTAGTAYNELVNHPERVHPPYNRSILLMRADENKNGRLEQEEVDKFLHSQSLFKLDINGDLTQKGIQDAREFVESAAAVVPHHANVVLSTLDAIELKQKANQQK